MKVNIRNDAPTQKARSTDIPVFRSKFSAVLSAGIPAINFAGKGYLMGMLGLTYTKVQTIPSVPGTYKSDEVPTVNIKTTD